MSPEDIAKSVYELDPMWSCGEEQPDDGRIQSELASWRKRVCKNERGADAGPVRRGGSSAKRRLWEGGVENRASGT